MLVVLPFYSGDYARMEKLLEWLAMMDSESLKHHEALLWSPYSIGVYGEITALAKRSFGTVYAGQYDEVGGAPPAPQNNAWQSAARHMDNSTRGDWLWLESDAVPIKPGWLDILENAHKLGGKTFTGNVVGKQHMTGCGIYPNSVFGHIYNAMMTRQKPFDIVAGIMDGILSKTHPINDLIQHTPDVDFHFNSQEDVDNIVHPEAVLFHKCKDGSLIDVLKQRIPKRVPPILEINKPKEKVKVFTDLPIIHVAERHKPNNADEARRVGRAVESWISMYDGGAAIPAHLWDAERVSESRKLPYLKDVLLKGMNKAKSVDQIIMFTNDDTILRYGIEDYIRDNIGGAICSWRSNFHKGVSIPKLSVDKNVYHNDYGRDMFAFTKEWLRFHWWNIPDFILGAPEWDVVLAILIRTSHGTTVTKANLKDILPGEMPRGFVLHESHVPAWFGPSAEKDYNLRLASDWYAKNNLNHLNTLGKVA